jgi:hypothetical protein
MMAQKEEAGWDKLCWKLNPALATVKLSHKFLINGISHEILKVLNHEGSNHVREQTSLQRISSFGIPYELILIGYYLQKLSSHSFRHAPFNHCFIMLISQSETYQINSLWGVCLTITLLIPSFYMTWSRGSEDHWGVAKFLETKGLLVEVLAKCLSVNYLKQFWLDASMTAELEIYEMVAAFEIPEVIHTRGQYVFGHVEAFALLYACFHSWEMYTLSMQYNKVCFKTALQVPLCLMASGPLKCPKFEMSLKCQSTSGGTLTTWSSFSFTYIFFRVKSVKYLYILNLSEPTIKTGQSDWQCFSNAFDI